MARWRTVRTQTELDTVLADGDWAEIRGDGYFEVSGSASVSAWDSASVRASGSASVRASDSASVRASGSASVRAWDSASVSAWDSASVSAWGSASVSAWDSASVSAWDSASVSAWGSASVSASDSASVSATPYVAVHKLSMQSSIEGGVVITPPDLTEPEHWLAYYGIEVIDGNAILYKGVNAEWLSGHGAKYEPGDETVAEDFEPTNACGAGLHFSPRPYMTRTYCDPVRFVAVSVPVDGLVPIGSSGECDKVKARSCTVLYECDEDGVRVETKTEAAS